MHKPSERLANRLARTRGMQCPLRQGEAGPVTHGRTSLSIYVTPDSDTAATHVATCLQVRWLPRGTLREHVSGTDTRYTLTASTARRPSWQDATATELRWFDATTDVLAIRIPLVNPSPEVAQIGAYKCPCPACPQCTADACRASTASSCCTDASCADGKLRWVAGCGGHVVVCAAIVLPDASNGGLSIIDTAACLAATES